MDLQDLESPLIGETVKEEGPLLLTGDICHVCGCHLGELSLSCASMATSFATVTGLSLLAKKAADRG
ncbi:hypothetical protein HAX54_048353 [Datura stramonium]|uniref:Uncharacterized protein n=1 Tax=Datura stramonium TaxID=4076 RepID=A0ABS8WJ99_DATST|nr:hypothetical protein [Datura stramonium]